MRIRIEGTESEIAAMVDAIRRVVDVQEAPSSVLPHDSERGES